MKYEIACTFCGHFQIYNPRGKKPPKKPHTSCKACAKDFSIDLSLSEIIPRVPKNTKSVLLTPSTHKRKGLQKPTGEEQPTAGDDPVRTFIDDPNELLMSNAIRALNKQNPHVSWGTLLFNILKETKQLETVSKDRSEVQSQLKQYSTTDLIKLRKKLTGNLQDVG